LEKIKRDKLVLDWRKKQQARAAVKLALKKHSENCRQHLTTICIIKKCGLVYQHVYEAYVGVGKVFMNKFHQVK